MEVNDDMDRRRERWLTFTTVNFDDYIVVLMTKLRVNVTADVILSGELQYPLVQYQRDNRASLDALRVPHFSDVRLISDPVQWFIDFIRYLTGALISAPAPVPFAFSTFCKIPRIQRQAESFIYSVVVSTL